MITERAGNLLEQPDLTHIAHQANLYHTMGAGIAKAIALKWPRALQADKETPFGLTSKLGTYSVSPSVPSIVNIYSQFGFGENATEYRSMRQALKALCKELEDAIPNGPIKLGLPHGMGCGLAGGDWNVVRQIIEDVFKDAPFECVIVKLP